jgi:methionyl-tRNA synthetase
MFDLLTSLFQLSFVLYPFLPQTAERIKKAVTSKGFTTVQESWQDIPVGQKVGDIGILFPRIEK